MTDGVKKLELRSATGALLKLDLNRMSRESLRDVPTGGSAFVYDGKILFVQESATEVKAAIDVLEQRLASAPLLEAPHPNQVPKMISARWVMGETSRPIGIAITVETNPDAANTIRPYVERVRGGGYKITAVRTAPSPFESLCSHEVVYLFEDLGLKDGPDSLVIGNPLYLRWDPFASR